MNVFDVEQISLETLVEMSSITKIIGTKEGAHTVVCERC